MAGLRKITLKWDIITGHLECDTSYVKREERVDVDLYVYESGTLTALATNWALNLTLKPLDLGDSAALVAITSWSASSTTGLYQATTQAISSTELDAYLAANNSDTTDDEGPVEVDLDIYYTVSAAMKAKSDTRTLTLKPDVGRADDGTPIGTAVSITSSGYTMTTGKLLGRGTASTGAIEEITLGTNLSLSGTTLSANDTSVAIGEITGLGTGVATALALATNASGGVITAIPTTKTLWVDAINGSDSNAGTLVKPLATPGAAKTSAASGDVVIVRPGSATVTVSLGKDGVSWDFASGSTISKNGNDDLGIFSDGTSASNSAMTVNVTGDGVFTTTDSVGYYSGPVVVNHASSVFTITARKLLANHTSASAGFPTGITIYDGICRVRVSESIGAASTTSVAYGIWWQNGLTEISAPDIYGKTAAVWGQQSNTPSGDMFITAEQIYVTGTAGDGVIYDNGTQPTGAIWITAKTIESPGGNVASVYHFGEGRIYVTSQKLFGAVVNYNTGLLYVGTQKISAVSNAGAGDARLAYTIAGTVYLRCDHFDPVTYTGKMIEFSGGTVQVDGGSYVANASSNGIVVSGADVTIVGMTIDTSANSGTDAVTVTAGTLRLINCRIISHSSKKDINQSGGTVTVIGGSGSDTGGALKTTGTVGHVGNYSSLALKGSTSGIASIVAPAAAGTPTLMTPTRDGTLALETKGILAANFVTTVASQGGEAWHAGYAVTSGKTYYVHMFVWMKWATAATSGDAFAHLNTFDDLTWSAGRIALESGTVALTTDSPDSLNLTVTADTGMTWAEIRGVVTMSATGTFRPKLTIWGWDSGDAVTVLKGSFFEVIPVD